MFFGIGAYGVAIALTRLGAAGLGGRRRRGRPIVAIVLAAV
jgi:ABC-type branched-subunit amino acid transport system permease subunit